MAHARARIGTRRATGGRAAARTAGASPSEARARRALAPGVGEPEATQHVSCQLIITRWWTAAQPLSTPVVPGGERAARSARRRWRSKSSVLEFPSQPLTLLNKNATSLSLAHDEGFTRREHGFMRDKSLIFNEITEYKSPGLEPRGADSGRDPRPIRRRTRRRRSE